MAAITSVIKDVGIAATLPVLDRTGLVRLAPVVRIFAQMKDIAGGCDATAGEQGPRVLFMTLKGGWINHLSYEFTLATALRQRGASCSFLLCDKFFPNCDVKTHSNPGRNRCWLCHGCSRTFARRLGMPAHWLSSFLTAAQREESRQVAFDTPQEHLDKISLHGIPIRQVVTPSLLRFFRRGTLEPTERSRRVEREFVYAGLLAAGALPRLLDTVAPDTVITINGAFFAENILFRLCRSRGIRIYTYERGQFKDSIHIARDDISVDWDIEHAWRERRDRPLEPAERRRIEACMSDRTRGRKIVQRFHASLQADLEVVRRAVDYRPGAAHYVLFSNVVWDTAAHFKDVGFANMFDWIRRTVELFASTPKRRLIVRIHPAEIKVATAITEEKVGDFIRSTFHPLPTNVVVLPPESNISSYALVQLCDAILVYTSTIGLEAALQQKPVIVSGRTHYCRKGFTIDVGSWAEYVDALAAVEAGRIPDSMNWDAAWKYAYVYFFECMVPFPWVPQAGVGRLKGLAFARATDLAPGRDGYLDATCDAILAGREVAVGSVAAGPDRRA